MKTKYILYALFISIGTWSCDLMGNIDDIKPNYKQDEENAIHDTKTALQAVRGVYSGWTDWMLTAFRINMGVGIGSLSSSGAYSGEKGFSDNTVQADNDILNDVYSALYNVINRANYVIAAVEGNADIAIPEGKKKEILGESKFHRAMAHFYLLRYFGRFYDESSPYGIVIRKTPFRGSEITARESVENAYTLIEQDLGYAILNAPESPESHCFISRVTAQALLAKVLLSKGDYPGAATAATAAIDAAADYGYELDDYANIFNNPYDSPEILFAPYNDSHLCYYPERIRPSKSSLQLADDIMPGIGNDSTGAGLDPCYAFAFAKNNIKNNKNYNAKYPQESDQTTYYYLRLGEIYYISAEAEARQGAAHYELARTRLQTVLDKHCGEGVYDVSGITDGKVLLETIRQHKWLELLSENNEEWFDAIRYHKAGDLDISTIKPTLKTESQFILPIPKEAIAANNLLVPNP